MRIRLRSSVTSCLLALVLSTPLHAQHDIFYPRPFPMGVSISTTPTNPFITAGTAGMRVRALWNQNFVFILSNAHVADAVGPDLCTNTATPFSTWILQPGTLDLGNDPGNDPDFFAGIFAVSVPINFAGGNNRVDAAIVFTLESLASREILGIGNPTVGILNATPGMAVTKSGRTTGVTTDSVTAVNTTTNVGYQCGTARFVGQISMGGGIGSSGDSGSVILDSNTLTPIGLFFAGSAFSGVANRIIDVYLSFGTVVDGTGTAIRTRAELDAAVAALPADPEMRRLEAIQARRQDAILATRGVTGIGIGQREGGDGYAFVVFTRENPARVPVQVPDAIEGVPVRLVEGGEIRAY